MFHLSWRGFSPRARSAAGAITAPHQLQMRSLATALLSSLCLMLCCAAGAQVTSQSQNDGGDGLANTEASHTSTNRRSAGAVAAACGFNLIGPTRSTTIAAPHGSVSAC